MSGVPVRRPASKLHITTIASWAVVAIAYGLRFDWVSAMHCALIAALFWAWSSATREVDWLSDCIDYSTERLQSIYRRL